VVPEFKIVGSGSGTDLNGQHWNIMEAYAAASGPDINGLETMSFQVIGSNDSPTFYWDSSSGYIYELATGKTLQTSGNDKEFIHLAVPDQYADSKPLVFSIAGDGTITTSGVFGLQNNVLILFESQSEEHDFNAIPVTMKAIYTL
jgi:hypothetical protein